MSRKTVTSVFGTDAANELAAIAIDLLISAPKARHLHTRSATVPWSHIERGREIMERHGIHWRAVKADQERRAREA